MVLGEQKRDGNKKESGRKKCRVSSDKYFFVRQFFCFGFLKALLYKASPSQVSEYPLTRSNDLVSPWYGVETGC